MRFWRVEPRPDDVQYDHEWDGKLQANKQEPYCRRETARSRVNFDM